MHGRRLLPDRPLDLGQPGFLGLHKEPWDAPGLTKAEERERERDIFGKEWEHCGFVEAQEWIILFQCVIFLLLLDFFARLAAEEPRLSCVTNFRFAFSGAPESEVQHPQSRGFDSASICQ